MKYILSSILTIGIFVLCLSTNGFAFPSMGNNCLDCHGDQLTDQDTSNSTSEDTSDSTDWDATPPDDDGWDSGQGDNVPGCGSSSQNFGCDFSSKREAGCGLPSRDSEDSSDQSSDDGSSRPSKHDQENDSRTDQNTDGRRDQNTDGWTDQNTDGWTDQDTDGWTDARTDTDYDSPEDMTDTTYDTADDTTDDSDNDAYSSGSLTITGSRFSEGLLVGFLSLPGDISFGSSILNDVTAADIEAFSAATISSDGSLENVIGSGSPITMVDSSYATATLKGGEHLIIMIIDNEPAITDYTALTDIGDNDLIGYTTVVVDGNQSLSIDYSSVTWTAVSDF